MNRQPKSVLELVAHTLANPFWNTCSKRYRLPGTLRLTLTLTPGYCDDSFGGTCLLEEQSPCVYAGQYVTEATSVHWTLMFHPPTGAELTSTVNLLGIGEVPGGREFSAIGVSIVEGELTGISWDAAVINGIKNGTECDDPGNTLVLTTI